jgi:flagellar hook-associated protein 3 FlgL
MSYISLGDLAQNYMIKRQNTQLKTTVTRLALELSTGRTSDVSKRFSGDFSMISSIQTSLKSLQAYKTASSEAASFATNMQSALNLIQDQTSSAASTLMLVGNTASQTQIQNSATDVHQKFDAVISALNTQIAGRSIFAGAATDSPATASSASILSALQVATAGQTTAAGVTAAVDNWFDASGGGFETTAYLGSTATLSPFKIGAHQSANISLTAADQSIRDTLKGLALASLVSEGTLPGNISEQTKLLRIAGNKMLSVAEMQTGVRAGIGTTQAHIDNVTAQTVSEISALGIARNDLLNIDPYETASELEAVQTQLETLYALTSRVSRLSLVDFLR